MHADEESDEGVLPMKRSNTEGVSSAESGKGRTSPEGNGGETAAARTLSRDTASNGLIDVRRAARQSLERDSATGIDGVMWQAYGENLEEELKELHNKVHPGSYRAHPFRRTLADGSQTESSNRRSRRFPGPSTRRTSSGFSHGFRPRRGQHDALDALHVGILRRRVPRL
jgi:RNA-directed DNA polymerase